MKYLHKYLLCAVATALMFSACEKASGESEPPAVEQEGYNCFVVHEPTFTTPNGAKVSLDQDGAWWENGDKILVNGEKFSIAYSPSDNTWYANKVDDPQERVQPIDGGFYILYLGDNEEVEWDEDDRIYTNVNFKNISVPLTAKTNSNHIVLTPCCAVLALSFAEEDTEGYMSITEGEAPIPAIGSVSPAEGCIKSMDESWGDFGWVDFTTDGSGFHRIVIPILGESVTVEGIQFGIGDRTYTTAEGRPITIEKGKFYNFNFRQLHPDGYEEEE